MRKILTCLLLLMLASTTAALATEPGAFAKGRKRVGVYAGAGNTLNQTYGILGGGLGYYLADGFEAGVDFEAWILNSPTVTKLTPQIRYVFWQPPKLKPYVGAFWRQTWVSDGFRDYGSWGGRGGVAYSNGRGYAAIGVVYERYDEAIFADNHTWYPEFAIWFNF